MYIRKHIYISHLHGGSAPRLVTDKELSHVSLVEKRMCGGQGGNEYRGGDSRGGTIYVYVNI